MHKNLHIKKHVMTGITYMIPVVVAGGILGALAKAFGGYNIGILSNQELLHGPILIHLLGVLLVGRKPN